MNLSAREKKTLPKRIATFIQKGKAKYGKDAYDYSLVPKHYKNNRTPVPIKCKKCNSEPFLVYPFAHTSKGDNQKGTCPHCYVPKQTIQETRWNPNRHKRIAAFLEQVQAKFPEGYSYPYLEYEYENEKSDITVICHTCNGKPYTRKARSLKSKSRYGGCKTCNKATMAETISKKNKERQKRNHQTWDISRPHGCIYQITNTKNGKFYIGYTTMGAKKRFKAHLDESVKLTRGDKKAKSYLHNAMNHHGFEHFTIKTLESYRNITPRELAKREQQVIAKMNPHYNISPGGEIGHYKHLPKKK